jgi:NADPH:quinone reductase-like Zn-dependent oxidoreductase
VVFVKAIVQDSYGSADVLHFREVAKPSISDHDVLVRVVAAGVDRGAWHFMTGQPYLMRILGFGLRAPNVPVPGTNLAGRVEAVGSAVTRFRIGDEVYGACRGSWAELACARDEKLALKPANLTFEQAAVVPYAGFAAWQAVHDYGHLAPGQRVLVVGATGAVGGCAAQLAKAAGAEVTGVCSSRTADLAPMFGLDHVIDYSKDDFADGTRRYDLVIDVFGRTPVHRLRRALTSAGRLVIAGGEGDRWIGGIQRQLGASLLSPFVRQKLGAFVVKEHARILLELNPLIEEHKVTPLLDRTFPLAEATHAVRYMEEGQARGRIALTV